MDAKTISISANHKQGCGTQNEGIFKVAEVSSILRALSASNKLMSDCGIAWNKLIGSAFISAEYRSKA